MLPVNEHTTTQNLAKGIEPEFLQASVSSCQIHRTEKQV